MRLSSANRVSRRDSPTREGGAKNAFGDGGGIFCFLRPAHEQSKTSKASAIERAQVKQTTIYLTRRAFVVQILLMISITYSALSARRTSFWVARERKKNVLTQRGFLRSNRFVVVAMALTDFTTHYRRRVNLRIICWKVSDGHNGRGKNISKPRTATTMEVPSTMVISSQTFFRENHHTRIKRSSCPLKGVGRLSTRFFDDGSRGRDLFAKRCFKKRPLSKSANKTV